MFPIIRARIEQSDDLTRFGIDAGYIRSLMAIAMSTSQRQIALNRFAAVLFGAHVVDLKRQRKR